MRTFEELPEDMEESETVKAAILYTKLDESYKEFKIASTKHLQDNYLEIIKKAKNDFDTASDAYFEYLNTIDPI